MLNLGRPYGEKKGDVTKQLVLLHPLICIKSVLKTASILLAK